MILSATGCGDRMTLSHDLVVPSGPAVAGADEELRRLAQSVPAGTDAPVFSLVRANQYVNTAALKLAWVNPTDGPWLLAPGAETLLVKRRSWLPRRPAPAPLIGTRVEDGKGAYARRVGRDSALASAARPLRLPRPLELDDPSVVWPGVADRLASRATLVALDEPLVLPPHGKGYIVCAFAAFDIGNAEFTLRCTREDKDVEYTAALKPGDSRLFGSRSFMILPSL
jgi:hypothetical protein